MHRSLLYLELEINYMYSLWNQTVFGFFHLYNMHCFVLLTIVP